MQSMVCTAMKSMVCLLLVIALVAIVDCRSRFKPHSKHLIQAEAEWPDFTGGSQWSHETTQSANEWSETTQKAATHPHEIIMNAYDTENSKDNLAATHPHEIIMNADDTKDSKDNLVFERTNPTKADDGKMYQGDMLLTDDQWAALRARKAINSVSRRWNEGTDGFPLVPYVFKDSVNQDDIRAGLNHWMEHTCIKFEEITNPSQPHLQFHISTERPGCWSTVGMVYYKRDAEENYDENGQYGQLVSIGSGCNGLGTVVHEVGHAIGFFHEQSRSDRDSYVTVLWENLADNSQSVVNFGTENDNNYSIPYDYTSIMHYGKSGFSINGKNTLVTNDILDIGLIGRRTGLSHRDKMLANTMYNCIDKWLDNCGLSSDPCLNDGYTGSDCSCVCPPGTSGDNCQEVVGDYYATPGCGGQLSSSSGTIRHPLNGDSYGNDERCIWTINAAVHIKITFTSFDTEENYDYLYIRDGENVELPLVGSLTGDDVPSPVQISTLEAYLVFSSDRSETKTGFELHWEPSGIDPPTTETPTDPPTTPVPTTEVSDPPTTPSPTTVVIELSTTTPSGCGGDYTSTSGTIRHPSSGSPYGNNENCVWTIRTSDPIKITFISFDLENNYDHLKLRDGNSIESTELGDFTGSTIPSPAQTSSNAAYIVFTSDFSVTRTGFELQWETLDPPTTPAPTTFDPSTTTTSGCGGDYTSTSGIIRHPSSGSSYGNNENCVWTIMTSDPIKITFISFDLESGYDHLKLRDGNSIGSTELGDFTGSTVPSIVQTSSNAAYIVFSSDHSVTRSGFQLQWETLDPPTTPAPTTVVTDPSTTPPSGCGGEYTSISGTIRHPSSGSSYGNNENCVWTIRTSDPIMITFITFDLENSYDHLELSDGNSIGSTELGEFTGSSVPSPVQTSSNTAYIVFTSDFSVTRTGFELQWETGDRVDPPASQMTHK